jgi:two-component system alkaline phosphatase synthesis response regulator PhoP
MIGHFKVEQAFDGAEGLQRALELHPDCMVVDVVMPKVNGLQLVRLLRGDPQTADIPLVILSAMTQPQDQVQGILSGADAYLLKPARIPELVKAIREAIATNVADRSQRLQALAQDVSLAS